jgi:hypothetical protein
LVVVVGTSVTTFIFDDESMFDEAVRALDLAMDHNEPAKFCVVGGKARFAKGITCFHTQVLEQSLPVSTKLNIWNKRAEKSIREAVDADQEKPVGF